MKRPSRPFIVVLCIITLIVMYFFAYRPLSDYLKVQKIKQMDTWVESFYDTNDRYPTSAEFNAKYPNPNVSDFTYYDGQSQTPSGFVMDYLLSAQRSFAYGYNSPRLFEDGYYQVEGCNRWSDSGLKSAPREFVYMMPQSIAADFIAGTVYIYINEKTRGKILLEGLTHPRLAGDGTFKNIYVLSGKDINKYSVQSSPTMQLKLIQNIGSVPSTCPSGYFNTGRTN